MCPSTRMQIQVYSHTSIQIQVYSSTRMQIRVYSTKRIQIQVYSNKQTQVYQHKYICTNTCEHVYSSTRLQRHNQRHNYKGTIMLLEVVTYNCKSSNVQVYITLARLYLSLILVPMHLSCFNLIVCKAESLDLFTHLQIISSLLVQIEIEQS